MLFVIYMIFMFLLFLWFLFLYLYIKDRNQSQHSVLRNFPLLGRIRYVFEMLGPEMRQYMFDSDNEGRPFSRSDFTNIVVAGKYMKTLIAFGSKRNFNQPGWYLKNDMFPKLAEEMNVDCEPKIKTNRYVSVGSINKGFWSDREGLQSLFPRGLDLVFTQNNKMISVPRTTKIDVL